MNRFETPRRLALGVLLIVLCSAALLVSDSGRRGGKDARPRREARIAFVQIASHPLINSFLDGVEAGIRAHGYTPEAGSYFRRFSAEGDEATLAAIARQVTDGSFDLVVTSTTRCLQAVAKANRSGRALHVFGMVTDPFIAGVGIDRAVRRRHPKHLVGFATLEPVASTFRLAKALRPELAVIGTVWNPNEVNSRVCIEAARVISKELDIQLLEAAAENSVAVPDAARSLLARGAEAIWVGGDNVANTALGTIVKAANDASVPVFSNTFGSQGTLFDLGPDYDELGARVGETAAAVLSARSAAAFDVLDLVPEKLAIDARRLEGLRDTWRVPAAVEARADAFVDASGQRRVKKAAVARGAPIPKPWRLHLLHFTDAPHSEDAQHGVLAALAEAGLVEGRDYTLKVRSAQGDATTLGPLFQAVLTDGADLIITTSTPTLQTAVKVIEKIPVVFTVVADPLIAGAGTSFTNHRPNITGISTGADYERAVDVAQRCMPGAKRFGTLFVPSEINSVASTEIMQHEAKKRGLVLEATPLETSSEATNAAAAMCASGVDAVLQVPSNLTSTAFASIATAAKRARLPLFSFMSRDTTMGTVVAIARDYDLAGRDAVRLALRVLAGESPATIPFELVSRSDVVVNLDTARELGIVVPRSVLDEAHKVIGH